jgi:hypothetical protein
VLDGALFVMVGIGMMTSVVMLLKMVVVLTVEPGVMMSVGICY